MKRRGKSIFFIVAALIFALTYTSFFGIKQVYGDTETVWFKSASDIRFGIDIKGGVDATFMPANGQDATDDELDAAESIIKTRLVSLNITDHEVYVDYNKDRIISLGKKAKQTLILKKQLMKLVQALFLLSEKAMATVSHLKKQKILLFL